MKIKRAETKEEELATATKITMKALKEYFGLSPTAYAWILQNVGSQLAHAFSKTVTAKELDVVIERMTTFWNTYGLGEMETVSKEPLTLEIRNCFDCLGNRYGVGEPLCPFKEGFVKTVLDDKLGTNVEVKEIECCGTGSPICRFTVAGLQEQPPI